MLKSLSAAAIALSLIAAPAFAQGTATPAAPATKPAVAATTPAKPVVHKTKVKTQKHVLNTQHKVKHATKNTTQHTAKKHVVKVKSAKPKAAI